MTNRLTKFIILTICLLSFLPAGAYDFFVDGFYFNKTADGEVEVTSQYYDYPQNDDTTNYSGNISIPKKVVFQGMPYKVTAVGNYAFYNCASLSSISIPNSIISIGDEAFANCPLLSSLYIPNSVASIGENPFYRDNAFYQCDNIQITVDKDNDYFQVVNGSLFDKAVNRLISAYIPSNGVFEMPKTVTSIGSYAFFGCSSLSSISIPNSVTSIGSYAFSHCSSLSSISIPKSITFIGKYTFNRCASLTSISIPNSVTWIGARAFAGCTSITSISIPNSVTWIGSYAFTRCSSLSSISIPNSVTYIGFSAFSYCSSLTSIAIPNSVDSIGDYVFKECSSLASIVIPNSVTSIGREAFAFCSALSSISIPSSVTSIGDYAFGRCTSLTSITIPSSVNSIGNAAFAYCNNLKEIYCIWSNPIACEGIFPEALYKTTILYVPKGCVANYEKVMPWGAFWEIREGDYTDIDEISAEQDGSSEGLYFDMKGVCVGTSRDALPAGVYIVKKGRKTAKVII